MGPPGNAVLGYSLMRRLTITVALVVLSGSATVAQAGPFGGFAGDSSVYLQGGDRLCRPVTIARMGARDNTAAVCSKGAPDVVARLKVTKGTAQVGAGARYDATIQGSSFTIRDKQIGTALVTWSATDPITKIIAIHVSGDKKLLAVEYEARMFGRSRQQVMGFRLPAVQRAPQPRADRVKTKKTLTADQSKALGKALKKARKLAHRGRHRRAEAAFRKVLAIDPDHPEARYGVAVALAGRRKFAAAIAELTILSRSKHPRAIVFLVEARSARVFRSRRAAQAFRVATLLAPMPGRVKSAYERVAGQGGTWEQTGQRCTKAWVNLRLRRLPKQTFKLRIRSRCPGNNYVVRLHGMWKTKGTSGLALRMPNGNKADSVVQCQLSVCRDGSGEDCMRCPIDRDLVVEFRTVRR